MDDIEVLAGVLDKLDTLVAGVRPDQLDDRTCCPGFDVRGMLNHLVGFAQNFAAAANGERLDRDPRTITSTDPASDVHAAAQQIVAAWRRLGTDRQVTLMGPPLPGATVLGMTIIEYVAHGCDLAMATGQQIPYTDAEVTVALGKAQAYLTEEFRGEGKPFGPRLPVAEDAPAVDRFLGFMGRAVPAAP